MAYLDDIQQAADDQYTLFGVGCDYAGQDASASVTAIIEHNLSQYGDVLQIAGMTATIAVRVNEKALPPRHGDTYTIGGTVYVVDSIIQADEIEHIALVA